MDAAFPETGAAVFFCRHIGPDAVNERDRIACIEATLNAGRDPRAQGLALDDDAFFDPNDRRIYTTDLLVEGRHFDRRWSSPADIAWKAAAVNISDIAAMGGRLTYLLVSLGLTEADDARFLEPFYASLATICRQFGGRVIGGDTVGADQLIINVAAVGELPIEHTLGRRSQAMPGDAVICTGFHGMSAVGLQAFQRDIAGYEACRLAHLRPTPRQSEALKLSRLFSRYSLMDSSDGLADAALKIAAASGVRLELAEEWLPMHPQVSQFADGHGRSAAELALYGGEDFELIATVPVTAFLPKGFTVIGRVREGAPEAVWLPRNGAQWEALSFDKTWRHFQ